MTARPECDPPPEALRDGRYVATTRNKVVHEDAFALPDRERFLGCARAFEKALGASPQARGTTPISWKVVIFLVFVIGMLIAWKVPVPTIVSFGGFNALIAVLLMMLAPPVLLLWPILRSRGGRALLLVGFVVFCVGWMIAAPIVFKDVIAKSRQGHALPAPPVR